LKPLFTLFHTNDFHNRLSETQAARLGVLRQQVGRHGLLLDAGDAIAAGNVTFRPAGEPILDLMSDAGYDAMTVGNREFHFSRVGFHSKLSRARFPILCANVRPSRTFRALEDPEAGIADPHAIPVPARPWLLLETEAVGKIVIFGLTVPMITERMLARKVSSYVFEEPVQTARKLVPQLKREIAPDLIIALTHIGFSRDRALAEQVPGIDLIIGGHSHTKLEEGERVAQTLIVQTGCYGQYLGRVEIERAGAALSLHARLEPL
jgi:2',3'-cyclic-nucleotide 2'-phosphodiesterase (5'-nucleotidase family)